MNNGNIDGVGDFERTIWFDMVTLSAWFDMVYYGIQTFFVYDSSCLQTKVSIPINK